MVSYGCVDSHGHPVMSATNPELAGESEGTATCPSALHHHPAAGTHPHTITPNALLRIEKHAQPETDTGQELCTRMATARTPRNSASHHLSLISQKVSPQNAREETELIGDKMTPGWSCPFSTVTSNTLPSSLKKTDRLAGRGKIWRTSAAVAGVICPPSRKMNYMCQAQLRKFARSSPPPYLT